MLLDFQAYIIYYNIILYQLGMTFCTYIFVVIQAIFTILTLLNRELGEEWNGVDC